MNSKNKYLHSIEKNSSYGKQWNTLNFSTRIRQHELGGKRLTIIFCSDICSSISTFILAPSVYCLLTFSERVSTLLQNICLLGGLYQQNAPVCDLCYSFLPLLHHVMTNDIIIWCITTTTYVKIIYSSHILYTGFNSAISLI